MARDKTLLEVRKKRFRPERIRDDDILDTWLALERDNEIIVRTEFFQRKKKEVANGYILVGTEAKRVVR